MIVRVPGKGERPLCLTAEVLFLPGQSWPASQPLGVFCLSLGTCWVTQEPKELHKTIENSPCPPHSPKCKATGQLQTLFSFEPLSVQHLCVLRENRE